MLGFAFTPIKCQKSQKISLLEGTSPAPRIKVTSAFEAAVPASARLRRYRIEASRHAIPLRPRLSLGKRLLLHRQGQQRPRRSPTSTSSRPPGPAHGGEPTDDDRRPRCGTQAARVVMLTSPADQATSPRLHGRLRDRQSRAGMSSPRAPLLLDLALHRRAA
jgi:hypothetical protein